MEMQRMFQAEGTAGAKAGNGFGIFEEQQEPSVA